MLRTFTDVALVRHIETASRASLYERRVGDNHHLVGRRGDAIRCRLCGGDTPGLMAAADAGDEIDEAGVIYE